MSADGKQKPLKEWKIKVKGGISGNLEIRE